MSSRIASALWLVLLLSQAGCSYHYYRYQALEPGQEARDDAWISSMRKVWEEEGCRWSVYYRYDAPAEGVGYAFQRTFSEENLHQITVYVTPQDSLFWEDAIVEIGTAVLRIAGTERTLGWAAVAPDLQPWESTLEYDASGRLDARGKFLSEPFTLPLDLPVRLSLSVPARILDRETGAVRHEAELRSEAIFRRVLRWHIQDMQR